MGVSVVQVLGAVMVGVGAWLELEERDFVAALESRSFLIGPYLIVAAGVAIILVAAIGFVGAMCDHKINRFLLYLVSHTGPAHTLTCPTPHASLCVYVCCSTLCWCWWCSRPSWWAE